MLATAYHPEKHTHIKSRAMLGTPSGYGPRYDSTVSMFTQNMDSFIYDLRKAGFHSYGNDKYIYVHLMDLAEIPDDHFETVRLESTSFQFEYYKRSTKAELDADEYVDKRDAYLRSKGIISDSLADFISSPNVQSESDMLYTRARETITGSGPYKEFINKGQYASIMPHMWCKIYKPIPVVQSYRLNVATGEIDNRLEN